MTAWLAVIGLGEDGMAGLGAAQRALVAGAETLFGGARHLALVPEGAAEKLCWRSPLEASMRDIAARRGHRVVVLASGDPLCYGVGTMLAKNFAAEEMIVLPAPGAFALACARLLWTREDCIALSLHGRPLDKLRLHLAPGARILALSTDGDTPSQVAKLLREAGWGPTTLSVFEHLGGPRERRLDGTAAEWTQARLADLNLVAIECHPGPGDHALPRLAGLPDDCFLQDGQITKREVRAATLAALAPLPGALLWDIGAGSGSIAIEWLRAERGMRAIAIERDAARAGRIAQNAAALGVPELDIRIAASPAALHDLPSPDAVFFGGGLSDPSFDLAWKALRPGGRLVANAVTLESEARLIALADRYDGALTRLAISRAEKIGTKRSFRPHLAVTQLALRKAAP
jgi:precorrin-6B C5,15-methyltransferase / cobalt-precorrin-6B C5,C15-methyltransferase